jgi:hypothetical protein
VHMITHHSKGENTLAALPMADTEDITKELTRHPS